MRTRVCRRRRRCRGRRRRAGWRWRWRWRWTRADPARARRGATTHAKVTAQASLVNVCKICKAQLNNSKTAGPLQVLGARAVVVAVADRRRRRARQAHVDAKHSKNTLADCFPNFKPADEE